MEDLITRIRKVLLKKEYIIGKKTIRDIIYIQLPKIFFTGFFCYILWKIHDRIKQLKNEKYSLYNAKTLRQEHIQQDIDNFEKLLQYSEEIEKENLIKEQKANPEFSNLSYQEIALLKLNQKERESNSKLNKYEYSKFNDKELKIIDEFEDWAKELKEKQEIYNKKKRM